jgi:hypothetical protein
MTGLYLALAPGTLLVSDDIIIRVEAARGVSHAWHRVRGDGQRDARCYPEAGYLCASEWCIVRDIEEARGCRAMSRDWTRLAHSPRAELREEDMPW